LIANRYAKKKPFAAVIIGLAVMFFFICPAAAADEAANWRPTYDIIMMWVNFLILAGVLYKFLKNPLMDFIKGKKYEVEKEIQKAEDLKEQAEKKIQEAKKMVEEGKDRFNLIKERIIALGEKRKEQLIEEAQQHSQYMLIEAKRRVDNQIVRAQEKYRAELVDTAFDLVLERLPKEITEEDGEKLVQNYIENIMPSST
jgi:F-type H+-transporting ATPase subunit b